MKRRSLDVPVAPSDETWVTRPCRARYFATLCATIKCCCRQLLAQQVAGASVPPQGALAASNYACSACTAGAQGPTDTLRVITTEGQLFDLDINSGTTTVKDIREAAAIKMDLKYDKVNTICSHGNSKTSLPTLLNTRGVCCQHLDFALGFSLEPEACVSAIAAGCQAQL